MNTKINMYKNTQIKIRLIVMVFAIFSLAGITACAGFPSENSDPTRNNKIAYNKDLKDCQEDYPEAASGAYIKQWISCMKLKGWK